MANPLQPGGPLERDPIAYQASTRPDALACQDLRTGRRVTFADFADKVARAAGWMAKSFGIGSGDRVSYLGRNSLAQLTILFACRHLGAIFQPLNWRLTASEIAPLIADASASLVLFEEEFGAAIGDGGPKTSLVRIDPDEAAFWRAIESAQPAPAAEIDESAPLILLYTSGTTGKPKGVIMTRRNVFYGALNFISVGSVDDKSVMLCDAPMFHTVGLMAVASTCMHAGAAILMSDRFAADITLQRLADPALGVTHYFAVPQSAQMLRDHPSYAPAALTRLKGLFSGGAPMPPALLATLLEDGVTVSNGYGMSEAGTVMHMPLDRALIAANPGCCGRPAPHVEIRIVTKDGRDAKTDEPGEIWLRGPGISPGYWNQPEASANAFADGWLRTGDAGVLNGAGLYRLIDRWKDMYITGGENVYPAEVEAVLANLRDVAEVAVVGFADAQWGESGCAFVVAKPGAEISASAVKSFCEGKLARYKHPRVVRVIDALPRTASGKVRKDVLRGMIESAPAACATMSQ